MSLLGVPSFDVNFFSRSTKIEYSAIREAVRRYMENEEAIASVIAEWHHEDQAATEQEVLGVITSSVPMADVLGDPSIHNRWFYEIAPAQVTPDFQMELLPGVPPIERVMNLWEVHHTDVFAWGVDMSATGEYPAGFSPQPVATGMGVTTKIRGVWLDDEEPQEEHPLYTIEAFGSHDGTCDLPFAGPGQQRSTLGVSR
jgi:hypothetical protein